MTPLIDATSAFLARTLVFPFQALKTLRYEAQQQRRVRRDSQMLISENGVDVTLIRRNPAVISEAGRLFPRDRCSPPRKRARRRRTSDVRIRPPRASRLNNFLYCNGGAVIADCCHGTRLFSVRRPEERIEGPRGSPTAVKIKWNGATARAGQRRAHVSPSVSLRAIPTSAPQYF